MSRDEPSDSIDWRALRALLRMYRRLAFRGKTAQIYGRSPKLRTWALPTVLLMYTFVGGMFSVVASSTDVFTFSVAIHAATFLLIGFTLTTESGELLFHPLERDILAHRPLSPRTLLLAKAVNFLAFAALLALALNLVPTLAGLASQGATPWFPAAHLLSIAALLAFLVTTVVLVHGVLHRFVGRERLDSVLTWAQVAMTILFIFGYQLIPHLLDRFEGRRIDPTSPLLFLIPPVWTAALDALACGHLLEGRGPLLVAEAIVATAGLGWIALGRLASAYQTEIGEASPVPERRPDRRPARSARRLHPILRWWLRDPVERAAFHLAASYLRRDRDTRLRLYPALSIFLVFPLIGVVTGRPSASGTFFPVLTIGMMSILPLAVVMHLRFSNEPQAAEVFWTAPVESAAAIFHGVRKAAILYLVLPLLTFALALTVIFLPGARQALLFGLPALAALPVISLLPGLSGEYLPLSREPARGEQALGQVGLFLGTMILVGFLALVAQLMHSAGLLWYAGFVAADVGVMTVLFRLLDRRIRAARLEIPD